MVVTDPPYNVAYKGRTKENLTIQNDDMSKEEFKVFLDSCFSCMSEVMKEGSPFYVWHSSREQINFETALTENGLSVRQQLIWAKNHFNISRSDYQNKHEPCFYGWKEGAAHKWYGDRKQSTILEFDKPLKNTEHPTMKPVELIAYQIQNSTKAGDTVLDIFGGSGTTLIAAEQTNRRCRTLELDEKYASVILRRWENLTGKEGIRI